MLLSLYALAHVPRSKSQCSLSGAICAGVIATYSLANGLLVWPILLLAAYTLRLTKRQIVLLTVSSTASDGLYFAGYRFAGSTNIGNLILHPIHTIAFVAAYLSMPFGGMKSPQFGVYVGLFNLAVTAGVFAISIRRKTLATPAGIVLWGTYAFTLLTALLTAAGRMELNDIFAQAAKAPRFLVPALTSWAAFIGLVLWTSAYQHRRKTPAVVMSLLFTILLAISFLKLRWYVVVQSRRYTEEQITQLGIENGITDYRLLHQIFPDAGLVQKDLVLLQEEGLSIFASNRPQWLGEPIARAGSEIRTLEVGTVTRISALIGGFEVTGWAAGRVSGFRQVLFTNEKQKIIGFGFRPPMGLPAELSTPNTPARGGWIGFFPAKFRATRVSVYVVDPHGQGLWRIPETFSVPPIGQVAPPDVGPDVKDLRWQMDPAWTRDGTGPGTPFGPVPSGTVYGTGKSSKGKTGQIASSPFAPPAGNCLVIPVLDGWSTVFSVELLDAGSGQVLSKVPMNDGEFHWGFWRLPIKQGTKRVRLVARDEGQTKDQWLAIASPAECRY